MSGKVIKGIKYDGDNKSEKERDLADETGCRVENQEISVENEKASLIQFDLEEIYEKELVLLDITTENKKEFRRQ